VWHDVTPDYPLVKSPVAREHFSHRFSSDKRQWRRSHSAARAGQGGRLPTIAEVVHASRATKRPGLARLHSAKGAYGLKASDQRADVVGRAGALSHVEVELCRRAATLQASARALQDYVRKR